MLKKILEDYPEQDIIKFDGFDDCIIGCDIDSENIRLIYSVSMMVKKLIEVDNMSELDAVEHFEFNIRGTKLGNNTPILCQDDF
jgi:hypothetical protein